MRNADKIKVLKNQNEFLQRKVARLEHGLEGLRQIGEIADALMIELIRRYGDPDGENRTAVLPKVDVAAVRGEYRLDFSDADKDGARILTVSKKSPEN